LLDPWCFGEAKGLNKKKQSTDKAIIGKLYFFANSHLPKNNQNFDTEFKARSKQSLKTISYFPKP